jgi:hypothetical protein
MRSSLFNERGEGGEGVDLLQCPLSLSHPAPLQPPKLRRAMEPSKVILRACCFGRDDPPRCEARAPEGGERLAVSVLNSYFPLG